MNIQVDIQQQAWTAEIREVMMSFGNAMPDEIMYWIPSTGQLIHNGEERERGVESIGRALGVYAAYLVGHSSLKGERLGYVLPLITVTISSCVARKGVQ